MSPFRKIFFLILISSRSQQDIRIMTTQVTLTDDVIKTLTRMGAKMTTKPTECTHLVCRNLVRTEKFLCAMAVAPYIVNEKWATVSAATKTFLRMCYIVYATNELLN